MSSQERLQIKGRLIERKQKREEFKISIRGLIRDLRRTLDPYNEIEDLDIDYCVRAVLSLQTAQASYKAVQREIRQLENDLGED